MLEPEYLEFCPERIADIYRELCDNILKDIIRRILKTKHVTETAKWQAEVLQEAGMIRGQIVKEIAKRTGIIAKEVQILFEDAGVRTVEADNVFYTEAGIEPVDIALSDPMMQTLEAGYRKTLGLLDNLTNTIPSAGYTAYINTCNEAYMKVSSGAFSLQEAVRTSVKNLASRGIEIIKYDSGHREKVDVAVMRAVRTGVGQTCAKIGMMNAEEMGCHLMEIDAHAGARPDHAKWQGKLVTLTGQDAGKTIDGMKVWTLSGIGYGTGAGFRGWNCRHDWNPYFPGISTPNYGKKELEKLNEKKIEWNGEKYTEYEISQMQRAEERKVRALKRECIANDTAIKNASDAETKALFQSEYQKSAVKLKTAEQQLKDFCKVTNQQRDKFREQVLGFSRSEAQKAVWASKKSLTSRANGGIIRKSGALNPDSEQAYTHAEKYYAAVRKMKTDVKRIAENTGFSEELVGSIKNFIFMEKHDLGGDELEFFFPDYKMAESWQRLIDGKNIQPHDLTLLKHEEMERKLMEKGLSQEAAHDITSETYNYTVEAKAFYDKIKKNKKE